MLLLPAPPSLLLLPAPVKRSFKSVWWEEVEADIRFFESLGLGDLLDCESDDNEIACHSSRLVKEVIT